MKTISSKIIAIILAVICTFSIAVPAMAADNSTGSKASDIAVLDDSNYSVSGKDTAQNKQSQYDVYTYNDNDIISSVNVYGTIAEGSNVYDPTNPGADDDGFVNGEIQVGVPTTIIISGTPNANGYYVGESSGKVKGNISGTTIINVVPDDEVTLSSNGKRDIVAGIDQNYTQFVVPTSEVSGEKVNKHVTPSFNDKAVFKVTVKTNEASAGSWQGSFNYNISLTRNATETLGTRVTSWNVSATENDDVWMTYYQPEQPTRNTRSTTVEKYENGTVVIRGTGNMEADINKHFFDINGMSESANTSYWNGIREKVTEEEYTTLLEYVDEGTPLYCYSTASHINRTSVYFDLPQEIQNIADKASSKFSAVSEKFRRFSPKVVIIENGVTNISNGAFTNCKEVTSVIIGEDVATIGRSAFGNCFGIISVYIPDSVTVIGPLAFASCNTLTDLYLPDTIEQIDVGAFSKVRGTIHCPNQSIADKVAATVINNETPPNTVID